MSVMEIMDAAAPTHVAHRDNHTHRDVNGGWLRPAVFGAMDGLVSNVALDDGRRRMVRCRSRRSSSPASRAWR